MRTACSSSPTPLGSISADFDEVDATGPNMGSNGEAERSSMLRTFAPKGVLAQRFNVGFAWRYQGNAGTLCPGVSIVVRSLSQLLFVVGLLGDGVRVARQRLAGNEHDPDLPLRPQIGEGREQGLRRKIALIARA